MGPVEQSSPVPDAIGGDVALTPAVLGSHLRWAPALRRSNKLHRHKIAR